MHAAAIALSAALLFLVQPIVARLVLPLFGGSAGVWSACLVFFQTALLAGYLYAHLATRYLPPRLQGGLHLALLVGSLAALPLAPDPAWAPPDPQAPAARILLLLAAVVGLPYALLASTSPLLSAWYARREGASPPYRLYALSNAGSLAALLAYPLLLEPAASVRAQALGWSAGYGAFALLAPLAAATGRLARRPLAYGVLLAGALAGAALLALSLADTARAWRGDARVVARNFYGTLRVVDGFAARLLVHGSITHGTQYTDPEAARLPTSYYTSGSGVGRALLAVHVSNRHLDLAPVVGAAAQAAGAHAAVVDAYDDAPDDPGAYGSIWVLVARRPEPLAHPLIREVAVPAPARPGLRLWTDDYSNLLAVVRWRGR